MPEATAPVGRAAGPTGNGSRPRRDVLGGVDADARVASVQAPRGRPAEAPWHLALGTVMPFAAGLSQRPAAAAGRARLAWKSALGLALTDPGCDVSLRSEFRARLGAGAAEQGLRAARLAAGTARGYRKARGRQRSDAPQVLGALRTLNRLERVAETLPAPLTAVATAAPDWLRQRGPRDWVARSGRRSQDHRLAKGTDARPAYAVPVGADGMQLLADRWEPSAPADRRGLAAVERRRRVGMQPYLRTWWSRGRAGCASRRTGRAAPPRSSRPTNPLPAPAPRGSSAGQRRVGDTGPLTETGAAAAPHLLHPFPPAPPV